MKSIEKVSHIVVHNRPHLDEIVGVRLLQLFGEDIFAGVKNARIEFVTGDVKGDVPHALYVGVGGGEFDEHRPDGRLQDTCAAMLVARRLRVLGKEGMNGLLDEVLRCDIEAKTSPTMLASLIKAMHRVTKGDRQFDTYRWASVALDALLFNRSNQSVDIRALWAEYVAHRGLSTREQYVKNVTAFVHASFSRRRNGNATELSHIVSCMDRDTAYRWLDAAFAMMVKDAEMYIEALGEIGSASTFNVHTPNGLVRALFVESDNEHIIRAAGSSLGGNAVLTVVRNSKGHTMCILDPESGLSLDALAAMIRMAEYKIRTDKSLAIERAEGEGTLSVCPQWHLPFPTLLLNGSLSHPGVEPSRLSVKEIQDIAYYAFTVSGWLFWLKRYSGLVESFVEDKVVL